MLTVEGLKAVQGELKAAVKENEDRKVLAVLCVAIEQLIEAEIERKIEKASRCQFDGNPLPCPHHSYSYVRRDSTR